MKSTIAAIFKNYALFEIFVLGLLSGMPYSIIFTLFVVMMKDMGVGLAMVTSLAFAKFPYSIKFLWSPIIDGVKLPILSAFGRRKSWMLLVTSLNILLLFSIIAFASKENFGLVRLLAICFGFCAATYDIAFDAWRIERVEKDLQATCASVTVFAFRIGALITSGGVMYLVGATGDNWNNGFAFIIGLFALCLLFMLTVPDAKFSQKQQLIFDFKKNVINPFMDFLTKPKSVLVLLAIISYKAGESMLAYVTTPFILDLGFTKQQWTEVVKVFGFIATTIGTFLGGAIAYRLGAVKGLLICGVIQMLANLSYIWLESQGPVMSALYITVAVDNFTGGMGMAALVGYLGSLCNREYTATQYALLSSAAALANGTITAYAGTLVEMLGWPSFFLFTVILSLPSLFILLYLVQSGRSKAYDKS